MTSPTQIAADLVTRRAEVRELYALLRRDYDVETGRARTVLRSWMKAFDCDAVEAVLKIRQAHPDIGEVFGATLLAGVADELEGVPMPEVSP